MGQSISRSIVVKSFLWKLFEKCSVQGVSFIVSIILARLLLPEEYGIISLVLVFINLANVIIEGGLSTALIQKKDADDKDFSTVFFSSVIMSTLLYILLYALSPLIADFYNQETLTPVIRVISISLLFGAVNSVQRAYVSKYMLFNRLFKCSFISVLTSGCIGILMAYKGFGVWALVCQHLLSSVLTFITMWFFIRWRPLLIFSKERFIQLFDFGWKILTSNILISLFVNIRSLLIGRFFAPSSLAFFDKGKLFPSLIMDNVGTSIQTVLLPILSMEQDNRNRVKAMLRRSIKTSSLFIFPLMIGLAICAEPLVKLILTEKWLPVVPFIQIFSISFLLMPIQQANMEAVKALGYSRVTLKLESYKKVLEVLILIVSFLGGVIGIAWGVVVYNTICMFINLYPCKKLLGYGYFEQCRDIISVFAIAVVMGICIYSMGFLPILNTSPLLLISLQIVTGVIAYGLMCYIFRIEGFVYLLNMLRSHR